MSKPCAVETCSATARTRGFCPRHYARWRIHGSPYVLLKTPQNTARNWLDEHVSFSGDDCLPWPFARNPKGYGHIAWRGRMTTAHRAMCTLAHGEPAPKLEAAHSCGNRICCNPRHIRWATPKENRADKELHGTVNRGERNGIAKLTVEKVTEIRRMVAEGAFHRDAAARFGVSRETVGEIVRRETWAHV